MPASALAMAPLGEALLDGTVDAVTFASPSAVRSVVAGLGARAALLDRCALAAIAGAVGAAVRQFAVTAPAVTVTVWRAAFHRRGVSVSGFSPSASRCSTSFRYAHGSTS